MAPDQRIFGLQPQTIAFIPFAAVDGDYESYTRKVRESLPGQYNIVTVTHHHAAETIHNADVIMTGGGNTFKLLHDLYHTDAITVIKEKVHNGTPYIGWAPAVITGHSICTTNDMPVIDPGSLWRWDFSFPDQPALLQYHHPRF